MQKYRVYFATKVHVFTSWFRRKEKTETDYVVVNAHNEAHAVKEAKKLINVDDLGIPFNVTQISHADPDEGIGYVRLNEGGVKNPE
jgi:hypothetical protein